MFFVIMLHIPTLYISESVDRGRGVFVLEDLEADNLIEICPLIIIPKDQVAKVHETIIHDYYFLYDYEAGDACIPLGYGCLYNHSRTPNARVAYDYDDRCIHIISTRVIKSKEEIFIDYTAGEERALWFKEG